MLTGPLIGRGKKSNLVGFLETSLRKKWLILQENFAKKQSLKNNNFVPIFVFFSLGVGGGGVMLSGSLCNNNNNKNVAFLELVILVLKPPFALTSCLDLVIVLHKVFFYQRSSFALLTTMSSEMHQWQSFLYHALASAQFFALIV